jgi:hypothetical protein
VAEGPHIDGWNFFAQPGIINYHRPIFVMQASVAERQRVLPPETGERRVKQADESAARIPFRWRLETS